MYYETKSYIFFVIPVGNLRFSHTGYLLFSLPSLFPSCVLCISCSPRPSALPSAPCLYCLPLTSPILPATEHPPLRAPSSPRRFRVCRAAVGEPQPPSLHAHHHCSPAGQRKTSAPPARGGLGLLTPGPGLPAFSEACVRFNPWPVPLWLGT